MHLEKGKPMEKNDHFPNITKMIGGLIYKQAAINAYCHNCDALSCTKEDQEKCTEVEFLRGLPSVQSERKTGQWLPDNRPGGGFWVCSCCKFPSEAFAADKLYKFCPNCGADLRGEQDE